MIAKRYRYLLNYEKDPKQTGAEPNQAKVRLEVMVQVELKLVLN